MEIIDKLLVINPFSRTGEKQNTIEKIIVHWVGNANTSAIANRNYFNNLATTKTTYASSQYIIGLQGEIIRCIPENEVAFHSGSYSMNRKSIGIEVCHPDWNGKFNNLTYESLLNLVVILCKKYNLTSNDVIRHYDVTGKCCPKYYVENPTAWKEFKDAVNCKLHGGTIKIMPTGKEEIPMYVFKNGKTVEPIFADTAHTVQIGSLNKYEQCECFGIYNGSPIVRYRVGNTNNFKIGFAVDTRCVYSV